MGSYRPDYDRYVSPQRSPRPPPLPRGPPPPPNGRHAGDSWRPAPSAPTRISTYQSDFSFRNSASAPQYPSQADSQRSQPNGHDDHGRDDGHHKRTYGNGTRRGRGHPRPNRGRGYKVMPSDRPLLQVRGGNEDLEQSLGIAAGAQKFRAVDDLSDSEEQEMELSDSSGDHSGGEQNDDEGSARAPPAKKKKTITIDKAADGNDVPRWSNPDPYSVLPPVDEINHKRKDPIKLIRKAFKPADDKPVETSQVTANVDFISFDDDPGVSSSSSSLEAGSGSDQESLASNHRLVLDIGPHHDAVFHADQDPALGSRKRTYDDDIKPRKGISPHHPSGSLLSEWIPRKAADATPWLNKQTSSITRPGFRLHREICDFYEFVKPQHHERVIRNELLGRLKKAIGVEFNNDCQLHCFGSFAAGLFLPNADMDVVVNSKHFTSTGVKVICQTKTKIFKFGTFLCRTGLARAESVNVIASAKVPIVKFIDRLTGIRVDVSFENDTGIIANRTFDTWKRQFPAMPMLVTIVKQFLMMRGLNEVQFGGLGGFSVTCLVVSLLQNMPRARSGAMEPGQHLGEILLEFLDFYGNQLDSSRVGIMMDPPGYFDKRHLLRPNKRGVYQDNKADRLAIIDPNRADNDISGGSKNVMLIFDRFARAHTEIRSAMTESRRPSLLDWMLGGDYDSFRVHRARLLDLYDSPQ